MRDLVAALALVLVIEGAAYALFPGGMKRMMAEVMRVPDATLRNAGLVAAVVGGGVVWLVHG